jgi:hypothetical protein
MVQIKCRLNYQFFSLFSIIIFVVNSGCSNTSPTTKPTPEISHSPTASACEQAAQDTTLSTEIALQHCLDHYHSVANLSAFFQVIQDGGKVKKLSNSSFAVNLRHQDLLQSKVQGFDPTIPLTPDTQISMSISRLASYCEELLTLFGKRGLQRIDASLFTYGVKNVESELLVESYKVQVKPTDLPKIKAWLQKKSSSQASGTTDKDIQAMWTVTLNRYKDFKYKKGI